MPKGVLPDRYGIADKEFPAGFGAQLAYPCPTGGNGRDEQMFGAK
jgi:hypothetical protein